MTLDSVSDYGLHNEAMCFPGDSATPVNESLYEQEIPAQAGFAGIIGRSRALREVLELVEMVAASDSTALLLGETGTGKELIARAIHDRSRRRCKEVRQGQLRRHSQRTAGKRTLWPRAWRIHRRNYSEDRPA